MQMASQETLKPIVGALFRYVDQFNHYKVKFNFETKAISVYRCTSTEFTLIMMETMDNLNLNTNLRIVIKFHLFKFKLWVHEDEGGLSSDLDEDKRQKEFNFSSDK